MKQLQNTPEILNPTISFFRNCKYCNNEFTIEKTKNTRGSSNVMRRVFCTSLCKVRYGRNISQKNKIVSNCNTCKKEIYVYPCRSETHKYCSDECRSEGYKVERLANICINCNTTYYFLTGRMNEKFCTQKCFKDYHNVTRDCVICNKTFKTKKSRPKQTCSKECGEINLANNPYGNFGARKDLNDNNLYRSSIEADFARFLNYLEIKFEYESKTFYLNKNRSYTPDFYLPAYDRYIEIKPTVNSDIAKLFTERNLFKIPPVEKKFKIKIEIIKSKEIIDTMKELDLYDKIENLEMKTPGLYEKLKCYITL